MMHQYAPAKKDVRLPTSFFSGVWSDALISDPEEQERHNADDAQRYPYCDTSAFAGFSFLLVSMCFRILRKRFPTYPPHFPSNTHSFDLTII